MKKDKSLKFNVEVVKGQCPTCTEHTMLVNIDKEYYRCITCGTDLEQKVNGKIILQTEQAEFDEVYKELQINSPIEIDYSNLSTTYSFKSSNSTPVGIGLGDKDKVLEDIDLAVNDKDFLAIIGPNGGGKTTLLNIISASFCIELNEGPYLDISSIFTPFFPSIV